MSQGNKQSGCLEILRFGFTASVLIPILNILYKSVLQSQLFEGPQIQEVYQEWPGLLDVVASLLRERLADTVIVITAGLIGALFYSSYERIRSLVVKTVLLFVVMLICMWPITWLISNSIQTGGTLLAGSMQFKFWNSVTMSFFGGIVSIWMFKSFLVQWNKWWDSMVDRMFNST